MALEESVDAADLDQVDADGKGCHWKVNCSIGSGPRIEAAAARAE
jgi:hypothetical protein